MSRRREPAAGQPRPPAVHVAFGLVLATLTMIIGEIDLFIKLFEEKFFR